MTERKTLFFHAGTVKTGSTAIQKGLWEKRDVLLSMGVLYPEVSPTRLDLPRYANADFLFEGEIDRARVRDILLAPAASRIVISEEALWARPKQMADPVFDGFDKVVVLYIRNPAEVIASWAAESAEPYHAILDHHGSHSEGPVPIEEGLEVFKQRYINNFRNFFSALADMAAGGARVVIRPYERTALTGGDAVCDFFDVIGVDYDDVLGQDRDMSAKSTNPSRNRKFCDVSTTLWRQLRDTPERATYGRAIVEEINEACVSGDDRPTIETLDDDLIQAIADECAFIEEEISHKYLEQAPLFENRYPRIVGQARPAYKPVAAREVELLHLLSVSRTETATALNKVTALAAEERRIGVLETDLGVALRERDHALHQLGLSRLEIARAEEKLEALANKERRIDVLETDLGVALRERDHARKFPWKYLGHAWNENLRRR